jgi:BolA protein
VTLVTSQFEGKNLVAQHRMVYGLFEEELKQSIHALALQTFTPQAWESRRG